MVIIQYHVVLSISHVDSKRSNLHVICSDVTLMSSSCDFRISRLTFTDRENGILCLFLMLYVCDTFCLFIFKSPESQLSKGLSAKIVTPMRVIE